MIAEDRSRFFFQWTDKIRVGGEKRGKKGEKRGMRGAALLALLLACVKASLPAEDLGGSGRDDDRHLTSVPLLYTRDPPSDPAPPARFVGGDGSIRLFQPHMAGRCCWGRHAMVRYEVSGALSVPEDGVVVFEFNGVETDVFPFPRGEFQAVASHPGNHSVLVAIENHDRTERFVESRAVLVIHAQGHDVPETERGAGAGGGLVLHHALRRGGESKCAMECVPTDTMDDARSEAAPAISARALASGAEAAFLVQVLAEPQ